jgi:hypothetical protein
MAPAPKGYKLDKTNRQDLFVLASEKKNLHRTMPSKLVQHTKKL